jgi:hypothetical protein
MGIRLVDWLLLVLSCGDDLLDRLLHRLVLAVKGQYGTSSGQCRQERDPYSFGTYFVSYLVSVTGLGHLL